VPIEYKGTLIEIMRIAVIGINWWLKAKQVSFYYSTDKSKYMLGQDWTDVP
jgi:hypothetical protein